MSDILSNKKLFENRLKHISDSYLLLKGFNSIPNNVSKLNNKKQNDNSKNMTNINKRNTSNSIIFNSTLKKNDNNYPLKTFYSDNRINEFTYNSQNKINRQYSNIKNLKSTYNKPNINYRNIFQNTRIGGTEIKKSPNKDFNISKSSDKSQSIFLTSKQNYYNYTNRTHNLGYKSSIMIEGLDPIHIPEEDKIFDELKRMKHLTKRFMRRYNLTDDFILENENKEKEKEKNEEEIIKSQKRNIKKSKGKMSESNKKDLNKKILSKTFYNRNIFKISPDSRELLNDLYLTSGNFFEKLNEIKKKKNSKKLKEYQNDLLDLLQPVISQDGYRRLKDKFNEIKKKNDMKKKWNYKFLNKIEDDEEKIVKRINKCYKNYLTDENSKDIYYTKHSLKYFDLNLPNLEFVRVLEIKKEEEEERKMRNFLISRNYNISDINKYLKNLKQKKRKNKYKNKFIKKKYRSTKPSNSDTRIIRINSRKSIQSESTKKILNSYSQKK